MRIIFFIFSIPLLFIALTGFHPSPHLSISPGSNEDTTWNDEKVDGLYGFKIPSYVKPSTGLDPLATRQYSNAEGTFFILVKKDDKNKFIDERKKKNTWDTTKVACEQFADFKLAEFSGTLSKVTYSTGSRWKLINGRDAQTAELNGTPKGKTDERAYSIGFVEGQNFIYSIYVWCKPAQRAIYQDDADEIINSFYEIRTEPGIVPLQNVNIADKYTMKLPTYLTPSSDLNDEASLQYQNILKEVYVIVIDEPKQDFIDVFKELGDYDAAKSPLLNYARAQMESITGNMDTVTYKSESQNVNFGNLKGIIYNVAGYQSGISEEMGFTVAFVEGKETLYMIMAWTFQSRMIDYQKDITDMVLSFREL